MLYSLSGSPCPPGLAPLARSDEYGGPHIKLQQSAQNLFAPSPALTKIALNISGVPIMRAFFLSTLSLAVAAPAVAQWPAPLKAALERSDAGPDYLFDVEVTSRNENGKTGEWNTDTAYARVDLGAPELKQITPLHLIDASAPGSSFSQLGRLENSLEDGLWCTRFAEDVPEKVEVASETADTITYSFIPRVSEDADGPEKKIGKQMRATITVSKDDPAVLSYSAALRKPVTLFVVFKIKMVETSVECSRTPDGRTYASLFETAYDGAGGGQSGEQRGETRVTALYDTAGTLLASLDGARATAR